MTLLKTDSIGFRSGEYGRFHRYLMPKLRMASLLLLEVCVERLSMKRHILALPFSSLSLVRYSLNLTMFTDCGNNMYSSRPFSLEMPESSAIAGSLVCDLSMLRFYFGRQYSVFGSALFVNIVSSIYMIR